MARINNVNVPINGHVLTIATVNYIVDEGSVEYPRDHNVRTDQNSEPSGQWGNTQVPTGTATVQLATAATAIPTDGALFTHTVRSAGEKWVVWSVGVPITKGEDSKVTIEFKRDLTP
jgi:hypothetical protein